MFNFLTGFARPQRLPAACSSRPRTCARGSSRRSSARSPCTEDGKPARIRMKMNSLVDKRVHPGALPRVTGGRAGRDQRPRHLLPEARRAGRVGEHPRRLDRRPLPRALADLRVRARRRVHGLHRLRGPDAAQPRHARRAADADPRRGPARRPHGHARPLLRRQHERVGAGPRGRLDAPARRTARSRATSSAS